MAKPKQATSALHDTALQLCAYMLPDKKEVGAQKTLAFMRERNKETKDKLHGVFAQMQTQFEAGKQIDGGMLVGVNPTGRTFEVQHIHMYRVLDGKIAEHFATRDEVGMMRQLGLLPPPPAVN
jgi:hypothetical protein